VAFIAIAIALLGLGCADGPSPKPASVDEDAWFIPDPRNWQGSGNRSVANMFIDLGNRVSLTDEQFQAEMAARRARLQLSRNSIVIGCPLCSVMPPSPAAATVPRPQQ
jgi:hypothetical protein